MEDYQFHVEGATVIDSDLPPRPYNPLRRPPIRYRKPILALILWLISTAGVVVGAQMWAPEWTVWAGIGWAVLYLAVIAKRAIIWMVHLYQNKASDETRLKCVFEPSCSEYMILAVNKYGVIRGLYKGIRRLLRCHPPNGGQDYP